MPPRIALDGEPPKEPNERDVEGVALTVHWGQSVVELFGRIIATAMIAAFLLRLRRIAAAVDADPAQVDLADIPIRSEIQAEARQMARDVTATHEEDAKREARKLLGQGMTVAAATTAIKAWDSERKAWKSEQVAKTATMQGFNKADEAVVKRNNLDIRRRASPFHASCPICKTIVAAGWIPGREAGAPSLPAHPNCIHTWEYDRPLKEAVGDADSVWLGRRVPRGG